MKYVGYFDDGYGRVSSPAAVNKMLYIANAIASVSQPIEIISCGMSGTDKHDAYVQRLNDKVEVHYFKLHNGVGRFKIRYLRIVENLTLFLFLLFHVQKNEKILVYHSLINMRVIYLAKKIRKFTLLLEVEEFYNDVLLRSNRSKRMEQKYIDAADAYIFPTELMNDRFNSPNKSSVIIYGSYQEKEITEKKFSDGKTHIVYSGTFEPQKGGAINAIKAATYLNSSYVLHILGFGDQKSKQQILNLIEKSNKENACKIEFNGMLLGKEFDQFLQKCDIGLSTQNTIGAYNNTSFPSKILTYMINGLKVVSVKIPVVEMASISESVFFCESQDPRDIAAAICEAKMTECGMNDKLAYIRAKFEKEIVGLLE